MPLNYYVDYLYSFFHLQCHGLQTTGEAQNSRIYPIPLQNKGVWPTLKTLWLLQIYVKHAQFLKIQRLYMT